MYGRRRSRTVQLLPRATRPTSKKDGETGHDGTRQCVKDQFVNPRAIVGSDFFAYILYGSLCVSLALVIGSHPLILQAELQSAAGDSLYFSIQYEYVNQLHK